MKRLLGAKTVLLALVLAFGPSSALPAADYPTRPVTLLIPMAPGGSSDVLGRAFASVANRYLDQPVVAVNKSGASGMIGGQAGAKASPALGTFLGPVASETRAWLDHLATGQPCCLAAPAEARLNLEVTLAIEEAARSRETVRLNNFS